MIKKLPNILTSFRILLVLFLIFSFSSTLWFLKVGLPNQALISFSTSFFIFLIGALTDFLDGWIARKTKNITTFGEIFDPLADKLMINIYLIGLMGMGVVNFGMVALFIFRDLIVDGFRLVYAKKNVKTSANFFGKSKTVLQIIGIIVSSLSVFVFANDFENLDVFLKSWTLQGTNFFLWLALFVSWVSGIFYLFKWRKQVRQK